MRICKYRGGLGVVVLLLLLGAGSRAPDSPVLSAAELTTRADAEADQKNYAAALVDYNAALALQPDFTRAYLNRGATQYELKDYPAAIASFSRTIELDPQNPTAYLNRGAAKFSLQDYPAAVADYSQSLTLNPNDPDVYYCRALAQRREGDYAAAFADYDHAIALDSSYWRAYNGRATAHNAHGDFELAIADYTTRIQLEPQGSEYAWFQRSLLLRRLGRADDTGLAAEILSWPSGWTKNVGLFLLGRIQPDELLRLAAQATDPQTQSEQLCEANYYVGITDLLAGRKDDAREKFQACVATGVYQFLEHLLARAELARMGFGESPVRNE